jgi:predicted O-methyltransferase YrrM
MSGNELSFIEKSCRFRGEILEIGTYCGRTTNALLVSSWGRVFSVDNLSKDRDFQLHHIKKLSARFPDRFIFIPGNSTDLAWNRPISVLFIDGNHEEPAVIQDLELFVPHLRPGGLLFMHDFAPDCGVMSAWEKFNKSHDYTWVDQRQVGRLALVEKHGK